MSDRITSALELAGAGELAPAGRAWLRDRLARWGHAPSAHNLGGLLCCVPHDHSAGGCIAVPVAGGRRRHVASFPSYERAAQVLVATARRASAAASDPSPDLPGVGYTSTHPTEEEQGRSGFVPGLPIDLLPALAASWLGPSTEAEAVFRGLLADWEAFEREGVPAQFPHLRETHATWVKFRDEWLAGRPDKTSLNPVVDDANRVRREIAAKAGKPAPEPRQGIDITDTTPALKDVRTVDDAAKAAAKAAANLANDLRAHVPPPAPPLPGRTLLLVAGGAGLLALAALLGRLVAGGESPRRAKQ